MLYSNTISGGRNQPSPRISGLIFHPDPPHPEEPGPEKPGKFPAFTRRGRSVGEPDPGPGFPVPEPPLDPPRWAPEDLGPKISEMEGPGSLVEVSLLEYEILDQIQPGPDQVGPKDLVRI